MARTDSAKGGLTLLPVRDTVSPAVSDVEPGAWGTGHRGSAVAGEQKPPGGLCSPERERRGGGTRRAGRGGDAHRGGQPRCRGEAAGPAPCCPGAAPRPGPRAGVEVEGVAGLVRPGETRAVSSPLKSLRA